MNDVSGLFEYKLLNQFTKKMSMKRICAQVYGMNLMAVWLVCDIDAKRLLNWDFLKRRQLFLELVAYHLEHKMITFYGEIRFAAKTFDWNYEQDIYSTMQYLEYGFSKDEQVFCHSKPNTREMYGELKIDTPEAFEKISSICGENLNVDQYIYIYSYCPGIAYWDTVHEKWIWI